MKKRIWLLLFTCIFIPNFITAQEIPDNIFPDIPPPSYPFPSVPLSPPPPPSNDPPEVPAFDSLPTDTALPYVPKPEMHISVGQSFGIAVYKQKNTVWFPMGGSAVYPFEYDLSSLYFVIGPAFKVRLFMDTSPSITRGIFIGGKVTFPAAGTTKGTADGIRVSEKYTSWDEEFISIMDFGIGLSDRFKISDRLYFISDFGFNITIMELEDDERNEHSYWGAGVFGNLFLQYNFSNNMYLEFGIESVINFFSSQEGKTRNYAYNPNQFIEYEDTGRWFDQVSINFTISVGWRIDLSGTKTAWTR